MSNLVRTTINIPQDLLLELKYYALSQNTSVSRLIQETVTEKMGKKKTKDSLLHLAGKLDLKDKTPPQRSKLYTKHVQKKMGY